MPTFICFVNWTDQAIRNMKDAPNRAEMVRSILEQLGGNLKDVYVTTGQYDLLYIVEAPDAEVMVKFALAAAQTGNVRTTTVRAFPADEFLNIVSELP